MKSAETLKPAKLLRKAVEERLRLLMEELNLAPRHPKRALKKAAKILAHIATPKKIKPAAKPATKKPVPKRAIKPATAKTEKLN